MTKSELITRLGARHVQLSKVDAEIAVTLILAGVSESLSQGRRIEVRGFGTFELRYRPARMGRNPKSGETVQIPGKYAPHFKAGRELRERVFTKRPGPPGKANILIIIKKFFTRQFLENYLPHK